MEFDKQILNTHDFQNPTNMFVDIMVMEFCDMVMEKSWKSHGILSRRFRGNPVVVP